MKKVYFISDAHLGLGPAAAERSKEDRLLSFLQNIRNGTDQLFILGDLFDAWFEYRTVIPKGFHRVLAALDEMSRQGIVIHFLAGNHDCWFRDYFESAVGIKTYRHPFEVTIGDRKFYLHHGDGLALKDTGYKILKKLLRNPVAIELYSWIHPDIGIRIARSSSRTSRQYTANKHFGEEDGMINFARTKIESGYDYVIMGHRHQPTHKKIGGGAYINLGDWISHNSYAEFDGNLIELKEWRT